MMHHRWLRRGTAPIRAIPLLLALCACASLPSPEPAAPGSAPIVATPPVEPAPARPPVEPAPAEPPVEPAPAKPPVEPVPKPVVPVPKRAEPTIMLTPEEQATDDVSGFMGAYISAIYGARARAKELDRAVRIRIDRAGHRVTVTGGGEPPVADDGREPVLVAFAYARSIEILKEPESVQVKPDGVIAFTGRDFKHPLPQKETAHVLAWVPKHAPHAFFRFATGKREFLAQQTAYIDETGD